MPLARKSKATSSIKFRVLASALTKIKLPITAIRT